MDNLVEQCEEIEAIKSIYNEHWKIEEETNSYSMQINPDVKLFITLNPNYPSSAPPNFELLAPVLSSSHRKHITEEFQTIYENNKGSPIIFQWIEKLKEIVSDIIPESKKIAEDFAQSSTTTNEDVESKINLKVTHGEVIQDRKSSFQAHVCSVQSPEETKMFINFLMDNKKIAQATHNISAYRIKTAKGIILQDCDDDGETHAGGRLLHLLQILDLKNIMVVVSRWYGGIHLGPDRFKHINNAARQVLVQGGFLST